MNFRGQLLLPNETGPGLRVNLDVAGHHLAVESETGGLGAWPLEVVDVRRLHGDVFAMNVAGEDLHFVADDALSFAYTAIPTIKKVSKAKPQSPVRTWFSRLWGEPNRPPGAPSKLVDEPVVELPRDVIEGADALLQPEAGQATVAEPSIEILEIPMLRRRSEEVVDTTDVEGEEAPAASSGVDDPFAIETWVVGEQAEKPAPTCRGRRSDGLPCESPVVNASGYCVSHDPRRGVVDGYKAAQEARARLKAQSTARLNRVYTRLDKAMRQVERGEIDPAIAVAMAQLARTMCAILDMEEPGSAS